MSGSASKFGKHEDFNVLGKAVNESIIKRDYKCTKWIEANCFRSSHYPYAEEWYQYKIHEQEIKKMVDRDQRHPSVIASSLFNEPESTTQESDDYYYFKDIFAFATLSA